MRLARVIAVGLAFAASCAPALAAPEPQSYGTNDGGGFHDVLPSGTAGTYNALELGSFLTSGAQIPHCCEQLAMYRDPVWATPGLKAEDLLKYYKDSTFGVKLGEVDRRYSPREDVTIVRDKAYGVAHVYGATRDGTMLGAGYAGAEDRLFFMDVLRNAGRAKLSSFAGGANTAMDADVWSSSPYSEADLQRQADQLDDLLGPDGALLQSDVANYVAGINQYIAEARADPTKMPGEYAALGHLEGPLDWKATDIVATAALVGGIFGKGGGSELQSADIYAALVKRFGKRKGRRVFRDFRAAEDPEAPVTVLDRGIVFRYQKRPRAVARDSVALPDAGSLTREKTLVSSEAIAIMDAWWPLWLRAQFGPQLGEEAMKQLEGSYEFVNHPNNHGAHVGSAFQGSWEGFASKDLRTVLKRRVKGKYYLRYCGKGKLAACRKVLADSLREALKVDRSKLYQDSTCAAEGKAGDQWCFDAIRQRPTGGATQPLIHWINRPTYQQANEIQRRAR